MKSTKRVRIAWVVAVTCVLLAAAAGWVRQWQEHRHALRIGREQRDTLTEQMLTLLDEDSRVRRPVTQQAVLAAARYTEIPELRNAETYLALGLERFYKDEQPEAAEEAFAEAAWRRPDWSWPQNYLGIVAFTRGDEERALQYFARAMELDPDWARPPNDLAILHRLDGRMDEALEYIEQAYAIDPDDPVTHYNHGVLLDYIAYDLEPGAEQDRVRRAARREYQNVIRLDPGIPAAHYNLACSYAREGLADEAMPHLKRAVELDAVFLEEIVDDPDLDPIRDTSPFVEFWGEIAAPSPRP